MEDDNIYFGLLIILVFWVIPLYFIITGENSGRISAKGRYKFSFGALFYHFGEMNMKLGRRIAETKKEREIRKAHELINRYNYMLFFSYSVDSYHDKDKTIKNLREWIDIDQVKSALDILELSYECWEQVATNLYYWGIIVTLSRTKSYYQDIKYLRNDKKIRSDIINSVYIFGYNTEKMSTDLIKEALEYFNISESDWIEYGDAVINMKNFDFAEGIQYIVNFDDFNPYSRWYEKDYVWLLQYRDLKSNDYNLR